MKDEKILGADAAAVESAGSSVSDAAPHVAHTPGPWAIEEEQEYSILVGNQDWTIARVWRDCEALKHAAEANAHLIAAAPEMKDALEEARECIRGHFDDGCLDCCVALDVINAAIAKAEGQ